MYRGPNAESASTDVVQPCERGDYWAYLIDSYQCRLGYDFPRKSDFHGHTVRRRTGIYQLVGWVSDNVTYYRGRQHIREDPDDDYRLLVPINGQFTVRQGDQDGVLVPGKGCLVTIDRPFAMSMSEGSRGWIMTIPRREIQHRLNRIAPPARPLNLATGLGRVAADLAGGLYAEHASLTAYQFDAVSERLVDLLCMLILGEPPISPSHSHEIAATVRNYIRTHADDPMLTGATVAHALGWSLRQIQLVLQRAGTTPRELIREERLKLARARLSNPGYRHLTITQIGLDLGFGSASSFNRAFHQRFGTTPGSLRQSTER